MVEDLKKYLLKIQTHGLTNDLEQILYVGQIGCTLEWAVTILNQKIMGLIHE